MPGSRRRRSLSLVEQEPDVRFYLHRLAEVRAQRVLIIGAANGRVVWELARHAQEVIAIEPSERLLELAEGLRKSHAADIANRVRLLRAEPRALRLKEVFPLVVAPQNALGLATSPADLDAILSAVSLHLSDEGMFCFDVLNSPSRAKVAHDAPHLIEPPRPIFAPHLREAHRTRGAPSSSLRRWRLRVFHPQELDAALLRNHLLPRERYGHFDGKPFEPSDALQVVIAGRG